MLSSASKHDAPFASRSPVRFMTHTFKIFTILPGARHVTRG
jgi:hypothetical protein